MNTDFPHLLSPLKVGPITVRNRVLVTAHVPGLEQDGLVTDQFIAYHRARARGGAGLQMTGSSGFHRSGHLASGRGLYTIRDGIVEGYRRLAAAIHAEGGRLLVQLGHSAATADYSEPGQPLWAPSPVASALLKQVPHQMTAEEIAEVVAAYGTAAAGVAEGGLDGVEILAAFGFLPGAFFSPLTNKRSDRYGGSLENRVRFALQAARAARAGAGADRIVGMRIPGDEKTRGGLDNAALVEIARLLAASGDLDYLNVVAGTNYDRVMRFEHWPASPAPHGLFVPLAEAIKKAVTIPVFVTGRVTDPAMAEAIIRDKRADMIGMTRAHVADPDIVTKITAGRGGDIRPCVGANVCIARATSGKPLRCFHNPDAGTELAAEAVAPAARPRRVAVIGGGPAGLEAARMAAGRGHRVRLYEAGEALGGQLALWARSPFAAEYAKSIAWYRDQLGGLQVQVETGRRLAADDLAGLDADVLVIATGSSPAPHEALPGEAASGIAVTDPASVLADPPAGITHAVIIDEGGNRNGLAAAEVLSDRGIQVTIVSGDTQVAESIDGTVRTQLYRFLLQRGVVFYPMQAVVALEPGTVVTRNIYSGLEARIEKVDLIVDWRGNRVRDDLVAAARSTGLEVHVIGDCLAPRSVHMANAEGAATARVL